MADVSGGEKRKLAGGGAGVMFKRLGEEEEWSEESEVEDGGPTVPMVVQAEVVEAPKVVEQAKIVIHDD